MRRRTPSFERCRNCGIRCSPLWKQERRRARWERNHETHDGRRVDCVSRGSSRAARGDFRTPRSLRRVPRRVGTNRSGTRGAGYASCAGARGGLRTAGVAGDCAAASGETGTVVAGVDGTTAARGGGSGCGADYRGVCCRTDHQARYHPRQRREQGTGSGARVSGCRGRTPGPLREDVGGAFERGAKRSEAETSEHLRRTAARGRFIARKPVVSADSAARGRCGTCQRAGRTRARALRRGSQPGRGNAGTARSNPEKDRRAWDFVQSPGGQQGTATTPGGEGACAGAERIYEEREEQSMTIGNSIGKTSMAWIAVAALLLAPAVTRAYGLKAIPKQSADSLQDPQETQDKEQEKREREQEAREREDEKREREQEARERAQEKIERLQELYDNGREDLDEDRYDRAAAKFKELADINGPQTDAALYWKAYAENRLGKRDTALTTIADMKRRFPQSRWQKDASALEIEVKQSTGQPVKPADQSDEELKMLAIQGLKNSDSERAMPLLEKVLNGSASPKEKSKALFVLAQSGSPQAREILGKIARGQSNPELQRKAVEYLGLFGGAEARKTLAEVYASSGDASVKHAILRSYMIGGDHERLFAAAKSEKDESLRREAIRQLGLVHGTSELEQLYQTETSSDVRREILQAFFLAGDSAKLLQAAQSEKDPEVRRAAIRNLGLVHSNDSGKALQGIYAKETDREVREEVLNAFFLQGNASALVAIARSEKDPELKKAAVQKLSLMHSKEGTDYLMELLQK